MSDKFTKAFPVEGMEVGSEGMNLRDYFAAKAISSVYEFNIKNLEPMADFVHFSDLMAEEAYMIADAMMEARKDD
ncbi:hypothetical protein ICN48_05535 [Polynucleobacter sp. JS-Safj-400b-B2]|uniref:hypothetical protein n=1 Tax=Polynucleobacter sp. JS-Safj-400b-B2 TaxID=2576921 RepID=UPI001C0ACE29|nr:hypothetical protein [Polynucleobacter sp. JS-Safj-400b-B2]MBU3625696.1 hypothetical protein [Polynucleobacter sp. JS-Safj-400b-B2]